MKKSFILFFAVAIVISSCTNDSLLTFSRPHFSKALFTLDKRDLKTAAYKDTLYVQNGRGVISAYFAIIQGEFEHVQDTIIQYGHCWSLTDHTPTINPRDTSTYSSYFYWDYDSLGTFTSYIPLYPETEFFVRSYVITSKGDTGYNQEVYVDTTLPPINEWFHSTDFGYSIDGREGAVAFTISYNGQTMGYITTGNDGSTTFGDLWEFNPETEAWMQLPGTLYPTRTEAVGFGFVYTDPNGRNMKKIYVGTGIDVTGTFKFNDFWEYNFNYGTWNLVDSFPYRMNSGVAFSIGQRAFVGTGKSFVDIGDFYMFDPKRMDNDKYAWVSMPGLGEDPVANARYDAVAFVVNDLGFVGLGRTNNNGGVQYFDDLYIFRPPDENGYDASWGQKADFPGMSRAEAVGFSIDNQGYVGLGANNDVFYQDLYRFDPYNDQWFQIADYKVGPDYLGEIQKVKNAVAFGIDRKGYVGTGYFGEDQYPNYTKEIWIYRPW